MSEKEFFVVWGEAPSKKGRAGGKSISDAILNLLNARFIKHKETDSPMRKLSEEESPYLRKAARQKVNWLPYSEEAFKRALEEGKPVFLSSGAGWCHWCHVQAKECFEDEATAEMLNKNFICVKIDRDLRPDIDRRYQEALAAMGQGGGWPLSIFLTHEGKPFYGGTYFPPEDAMGRPGFKRVLMEVAKFYGENMEKAHEYGDRVIEHLKPRPLEKVRISRSSIDDAAREVLADFDLQNGGFGKYPKFPMPGAMSFLAGRYFIFTGGNQAAGEAIEKTLSAMAKGGIHDQLGGGFHRYSTDAAWIIPHFEKLAEDNAWLLMNYIEGFHLFGNGPLFRKTALGIIDFARTALSDPEGGFYASQDADVTPEDEGGYFTWSREEFQSALEGEELQIASMHFLHEKGAMPGEGLAETVKSNRHVLFVAMEPEEISGKTGIGFERVNSLIESARRKLLAVRFKRQEPFVDKTLYASLNGLFISAYLAAWRAFEDPYTKDFALLSLKRVMSENFRGGILYRSAGVHGMLDDYTHMTGALLDAYENTGEREFLQQAEGLALALERDFWDSQSGGFFDSRQEVVGLRFKNIEDIPHPSANALLIWHFVRLAALTGKEDYMRRAEESLEVFSGRAKGLGVHAGAYYFALDGFYNFMSLKVEADFKDALAEAARGVWRPHKIIFYDGQTSGKKGAVMPCLKGRCLEAAGDAGALRKVIGNPIIA